MTPYIEMRTVLDRHAMKAKDSFFHVGVFICVFSSGLVSEPAMKFCSESVSPYLTSILEELMGPVSSGFQAVRQRLETDLNRICKDFQPGGTNEELTKVRREKRKALNEVQMFYLTVMGFQVCGTLGL